MEQNQTIYEEEKGISLRDLFFLVKKNLIMIIVITAICTLAGGIYGLKFKKITYTSKAEAIVMVDSTNSSASQAYQEYLTSTYLINTFNSLIKSNKVVNEVAESLTSELEAYKQNNPGAVLPENYQELSNPAKRGSIITSIQNNTTVTTTTNSLYVTIKYKSNNEALSIVVANLLIEKTQQVADNYVLNELNEKVYDYPNLQGNFGPVDKAVDYTTEASRGAAKVIIICFLIGFVVSFAIAFIEYLLDDTYTSKEEFEKAFNINVLTLLPDFYALEERAGKK